MEKFKQRFVTTVNYDDHPEFAQRSILLSKPESSLLGEIKFIPQLVRATSKANLFLLNSTSGKIHPDVLATILIRLLPWLHRPVIVFMGAMWQRDDGIKGLLQKLILRLADGAVARYAVQSTDEIPLFASAWGISESKMRFVPYIYTFTDKDLSLPAPAREGFIFAGGNSHRDYEPFLEAINVLQEHKFIIATHLLEGKTLPPNVKAGPVPREEFIRLMRASYAVVVPIKKGLIRAVGQQTYLNAMMLGKPTIVSNALGVIDHVQDGRTAIIVSGEPESYVQAIRKVMDPTNKFEIDQMCKNARDVVLGQFNFERHAERLLAILDEAAENR
jgi:glycosyltransferase involved in cell wall biosynthesis